MQAIDEAMDDIATMTCMETGDYEENCSIIRTHLEKVAKAARREALDDAADFVFSRTKTVYGGRDDAIGTCYCAIRALEGRAGELRRLAEKAT